MTDRMNDLIARSSLGTPAARAVRAAAPKRLVDCIVAASSIYVEDAKRDLEIREERPIPLPIAKRASTTEAVHEGEHRMKGRKTSPAAARAASKVLRSGSTGKASKTAAGSALSQAAPKRGKR